MAENFATHFPQNINCNLIYDKTKKYYRPQTDTDFAGGSAGADAFGRQRVSNPETIFNSKQIFDNQPLYWDDIQESGSGTSSTHSADTASSVLAVSATTAGKRTRQTYMRFNYQPSKSQAIFITGVIKKSGGGTGITARMGLFDDDNGLFLETTGNSTINLVKRSNVTGSPANTTYARSAWNIDKMDGSGVSGVDLDFTKAQILVIDFEWLGVGRVRMGFNVNGVTYYCHEILNANNISNVYMSTPNLPLRYQIENSGVGAASSMECICSAVISEGGNELIGTNTYFSTATTPVTSTNDFNNAVLAFRLKESHIGCTVDIIDASLLIDTNDNYEWSIVMNPSGLGSPSFVSPNASAVEYAIVTDETHISGGHTILGGYGQAKTATANESLKSLLKLGSSITGKRDIMVLSCRPLGTSNANLYAGITIREF